jgi:hypothetical protein
VGCGRAGQDQVKNIRNFHLEVEVLTANAEYQFIPWLLLKVLPIFFNKAEMID